jgi:hypothetical protein
MLSISTRRLWKKDNSRFHLKSEAEVKIREQLNSILKAVQIFKDFGTSFAALDPVHAGIQWAAVNLILQVS